RVVRDVRLRRVGARDREVGLAPALVHRDGPEPPLDGLVVHVLAEVELANSHARERALVVPAGELEVALEEPDRLLDLARYVGELSAEVEERPRVALPLLCVEVLEDAQIALRLGRL